MADIDDFNSGFFQQLFDGDSDDDINNVLEDVEPADIAVFGQVHNTISVTDFPPYIDEETGWGDVGANRWTNLALRNYFHRRKWR